MATKTYMDSRQGFSNHFDELIEYNKRGLMKDYSNRPNCCFLEYLYLVCRCENDIYLEKEKHSGFVIKLDKKDFHDEKIINFARKYSLIINDDNFIKIGEYILKPKKGKDIFYHCYLVTLPKSLESSEYVAYNKKDIVNLDFDSLDRQIIFRVLLQENFKIEKEI